MEQLTYFIKGLHATAIIEQIAVITALIYVVLISLKNQWGWLFATISSSIYIFICYIGKLYLETGLQVFYVAMAIYGWYEWSDAEDDPKEGIVQWTAKVHLKITFVGLLISLLTGAFFYSYTEQVNPYPNAFTTIFSLIATYMLTRKILENWFYWLVINTVTMFIYANRGLELTAVLYLLYNVISIYGYINWKKTYTQQ